MSDKIVLTRRGKFVLLELPTFIAAACLGVFGGYLIALWFGLTG